MSTSPDPNRQHLIELEAQYRAEELAMTRLLSAVREELEFCQRERRRALLWGNATSAENDRECTELEAEYDRLAMEVAHVRLAVLGVRDEIAGLERYGRRRASA